MSSDDEPTQFIAFFTSDQDATDDDVDPYDIHAYYAQPAVPAVGQRIQLEKQDARGRNVEGWDDWRVVDVILRYYRGVDGLNHDSDIVCIIEPWAEPTH